MVTATVTANKRIKLKKSTENVTKDGGKVKKKSKKKILKSGESTETLLKKRKKKAVKFSEPEEPVSIDGMISALREQTESEEVVPDLVPNENVGSEEEDLAEEETVDEKEHSKLLKSLGVEENKRKLKEKTLPVEPSEKEIEGAITISDLINSAGKSEGVGAVKRMLDSSESRATFEEPLPRHQREQAEREVNYEKSKKEVTKWVPLVKRNRETEHMSYPLFHAQTTKQSREDTTAMALKHKPTTKLEEEIFEVLSSNSEYLERPDHMLTEAEERSLAELEAEEAEFRREELSKMRALLSYQEEKFRRKNKIKSKTYHKLLKKERIRKEEKSLADALKADPSVAGDEQEKADYLRALERISQKHKVGGKWNKNLLHKNIKDPGLKAAMSEQRQLRHKLMEKKDESDEEDDDAQPAEESTVEEDGEGEGGGDVEEAQTRVDEEEFEVDPHNPWLAVGDVLSKEVTLADKEVEGGEEEAETEKSGTLENESVKTPTQEQDSTAEEGNTAEKPVQSEGVAKDTAQAIRVPVSDIDQDTLVDMAFANDDVVAQFVEEKEKVVDEETEKDMDITLPGWGCWAGIGTNDKPRQRIIKKAAPTGPRKDAGLDHVIINTKKNRKLMQHQVKHLPHPYKSRSVFEREMRQPIGPQWNSVRAFKNMIKPAESVLDGHIIEPMTAPKGFDRVIIRGRKKNTASSR